MTQKTRIWYPENATVEIYTHKHQETATGAVDGSNSVFTVSGSISPVTGIDDSGAPLAQYTDANGSVARRDVLVYAEKDEALTEWDTSADGSIAVTADGSLTFENAPTASQADDILVTYANNKVDKTLEVTSVSESGGERSTDYVQVYGGKRIKTTNPQGEFEVSVETLKEDLDFSEMVNGHMVTEAVSGSGSVYTVRGGQNRDDKCLAIKNEDSSTGNEMQLIYWNVSGVSKEMDMAAEEHYTESVSFSTRARDKVEIHWEL